MRRLLATLALLLLPATAHAGPSRHVDPMIGTFAPGFVVPGASTPFGMVQNSPDTRGEFAYSGYVHHDPSIHAFSLVHLSGPGVKKAGDVGFMPVVGDARPPTPFDHARERASAGAYDVTLANGIAWSSPRPGGRRSSATRSRPGRPTRACSSTRAPTRARRASRA